VRIAFALVGLVGLDGLVACDRVYGLRGRTEDAPVIEDAPIDQPLDVAEANCVKDASRPDDEDGDDFPNSCDNCPHVAQPDQTDADGDDVGNADPESVGLWARLGPTIPATLRIRQEFSWRSFATPAALLRATFVAATSSRPFSSTWVR
jgi:hypothetical protein